LCDHPRIQPLKRDYDTVVPHIYVVCIASMRDRKELQARLLDQGVQTGIHYQPNHWLSLYRDPIAAPLPVTDSVFPDILTLPLHADLSEANVERVVSVLKRGV